MQFQDEFPWVEFIERFLINHEEFRFIYGDKIIDISYVTNTFTAISYGNKEIGFLKKDYNSPKAFLEDALFDGKCFQEIWSDLK